MAKKSNKYLYFFVLQGYYTNYNVENRFLRRDYKTPRFCGVYDEDSNELQENLVYLNAHGDFMFDCDLSYEQQRRMKTISINDPRWKQKLIKKFKE